MSNVKCVCYHYDPHAPIKSQKLDKKSIGNLDKSRFDIYTPGRIFNLKSDYEDTLNSEQWIGLLQQCAAYYNKNYDTHFL